jgi:hypothetical protein
MNEKNKLVFVHGRPLQPSLMHVSKGEPFQKEYL